MDQTAVRGKLNRAITQTAKYVFEKIARWEIPDLKNHDPSFDELARKSKVLVSIVKASYDDPDQMEQTHRDYVELVEILESVAHSIKHDDEKLLVDCVTHLGEFIEIRRKT